MVFTYIAPPERHFAWHTAELARTQVSEGGDLARQLALPQEAVVSSIEWRPVVCAHDGDYVLSYAVEPCDQPDQLP